MDGPHTRTLRRALKVLGGSKTRLAAALALPVDELDAYLAGSRTLPYQAFLAALDIVAGNGRRDRSE